MISELTATEACLCTFNLLCPYDKELPKIEGQEVVDNFYGDAWKSAVRKPMEERLEREKRI